MDLDSFARFLIEKSVLKFGQFTLKSGRQSPYFLNMGSVCDGQALHQLAEHYSQALVQHFGDDIDVVYGPPYKGIPLCVAISMNLSASRQKPVAWTFSRKEEKTHGDGGRLVGHPLQEGLKVVLVDDVITAGTAQREVIPMLKESGCQLRGALVAVDREEPGPDGQAAASEAIEKDLGVPVKAIARISELVNSLHQQNMIDQEQVTAMEAYWRQLNKS